MWRVPIADCIETFDSISDNTLQRTARGSRVHPESSSNMYDGWDSVPEGGAWVLRLGANQL